MRITRQFIVQFFRECCTFENVHVWAKLYGKIFNERALCCRMQKIMRREKGDLRSQLNHPAMLCSDIKFDSSVYQGQQQALFNENGVYFGATVIGAQQFSTVRLEKYTIATKAAEISKRGFANMFESVCKSWVLRSRMDRFLGKNCTISGSDLLLQYNVLKTVGRAAHICTQKKVFCAGYNKKPKKRKKVHLCDNGNDEPSMICGTGTWVKSPSIDLGVVIPRNG